MTETDIEHGVTTNPDQELYVIQSGGGYSCLGFDVVLGRIDRYTTELAGRHALPGEYVDGTVKVERGSMEAYDTLKNLEAALKRACDADGERAVADLTPQLIGLEGYRVEVVDREGDAPRRFIVGKSTGWLPIHLELHNRNSTGGGPARREYRSVKQIERVR